LDRDSIVVVTTPDAGTADLVATARLAARNRIDPAAVAGDLERWARGLGGEVIEGEVIEGEVLWLPANRFDTV
jgi:hypothetical protein